jgi:hypothetical protein
MALIKAETMSQGDVWFNPELVDLVTPTYDGRCDVKLRDGTRFTPTERAEKFTERVNEALVRS